MVIGIDIGGTNIRGILWNGKKVLRSFVLPTPKSLKIFEKLILKLINNFGVELRVGIGIAGIIKNNKVISATNISYIKNFKFKILNLKLDNDARCFARAEYKIGAGYGAKSILMITLGTGIGRAYGKNGKILNIKKFEKEEKWEKAYQKIHSKKKLAKFLGKKLVPIIYALDPEIIVLGGGVADKKGYFETINNQLSNSVAKLVIRRSKLGEFAGAIGAAMLHN